MDRLVREDAGREEPRKEALTLMGQVGGGRGAFWGVSLGWIQLVNAVCDWNDVGPKKDACMAFVIQLK